MTVIAFPVRPTGDPQRRAADPELSAFVTANAGSGKTKTLIDRVARLLLAGAKPETVLCVTYTKAAASEMQRRLFDALGGWSVQPDADLAAELKRLDGGARDGAALSQARSLFAQALETPGGLKIQTIHAFCEKLLKRFPLEAGVPPRFRVMDDSASAAVAAAARGAVARHALETQGDVAEAYARMSVALDFQTFQDMFTGFETRRGELKAFFDRHGGLDGAVGWVWRAVDVARGSDPQALADEAMAAANLETYRRAARALEGGGKRDQNNAGRFTALVRAPSLAAALKIFFNEDGEGDAAKWIETSVRLKADPTLQHLMLAEQARLEAARTRLRAAAIAQDTAYVLVLAAAYLAAYAEEKRYAGALDFADLIEKTCHLLRDRPAAAWVLYKLDGGIDHILVDEAQDTAPDQWKIVDALTEEFFSGAGVRGDARVRDLFVVGDEKQSIYSFQGARPDLLLRKFEFHSNRATSAGYRFERVDLLTSWRSTPQVLRFVDAVFAPPALAAAIQPRPGDVPEEVRHEPAPPRRDHPGCVDVWPLEVDRKAEEREAWDAPLDAEPEDSANRRLARRMAAEIRSLIDRGDRVFDKERQVWRPAHAGDVLILVRRRRVLFEEILRALKREGIDVAGADRLALSEHIVFDDLEALARFVLYPTDELNLAALLKSPFCGLTDDGLYELAHGRGANLWEVLRARGGEAAGFLEAVIADARNLRPFEFYARALGRKGVDGRTMRQRLLRRLGGEAEDALDEFLNQVLAAENRGVHDLERLCAELDSLAIEVKREMDAERREVRVMTAHGAKGLEAPIVFLPETTLTRTARGSPLLVAGREGDEGFLWCSSAARDCEATADARARRARREDEEAYRLLYVALTRARDRLVLCGRRSASSDEAKIRGWWGAVNDALAHEDIAVQVRNVREGDLEFRRYGEDPQRMAPEAAGEAAEPAPLPPWTDTAPATETFARYASPSDLGEGAESPAPSPLGAVGGLGRFRRGDLIHRLLQVLPDLEPAARADGARSLLARERDLTEAQRAEMTAAAMSVLEDARFAEVFGSGSRAEVAIAGSAAGLPPGLRISGRIDRLVVLPDRVLVADFKSNRPSPDRVEDADPAYLRQMAIYAAVLADVFPGRTIEAALVWTDGPKLMPVPENLLVQSLVELGRAG